MEVSINRYDDGVPFVRIEGARYVDLTCMTVTMDGKPHPAWHLCMYVQPAELVDLCNAIRSLRDSDHDAANVEHAERQAILAELQASAERYMGGETS